MQLSQVFLQKMSGWYASMDIIPFNVLQVTINPLFQFHFNTSPGADKEYCINPGVVASYTNSKLTQSALEFYEELAKPQHADLINYIRSPIATIRLMATENTVGNALLFAVQKIFINGIPLVENGKELNIINHPSVFSAFEDAHEQTWLYKNKANADFLRGIIKDDSFDRYVQNNQVTLDCKIIIDAIIKKIDQVKAVIKDKKIFFLFRIKSPFFSEAAYTPATLTHAAVAVQAKTR